LKAVKLKSLQQKDNNGKKQSNKQINKDEKESEVRLSLTQHRSGM
jgi:hypothetical protein